MLFCWFCCFFGLVFFVFGIFFVLCINCLVVLFIDGLWFVVGVVCFEGDFLISVCLLVDGGVIVLFEFEIVGVIELGVCNCVSKFIWFLFFICWVKFVEVGLFILFILRFVVIGILLECNDLLLVVVCCFWIFLFGLFILVMGLV